MPFPPETCGKRLRIQETVFAENFIRYNLCLSNFIPKTNSFREEQ